MKKKIFCVLRSLGSGGAQKALVFVANQLAESPNYEVVLVSLYRDSPSLTLAAGVQVIYGPYAKKEFSQGSLLARKWMQLCNLFWLRRTFRKNRISLLIVFLADLVFLCKIASIGLRIPFIASERGTPQDFTRIQKLRYSLGYRWADHVVFQTRRQQDCFALPIQAKSSIIGNALVARGFLKTEIAHRGLKDKKKFFLAAGALSPIKGFDIAIRAAKIVSQTEPEFQLHIFGEGPQRPELENLIEKFHLQNNVFLRGECREVFAAAGSYAGFLLSSRGEGFPNVLLEAILAGLPVVATDCLSGGPREILNDGKTGHLVPVGNVEKMAQAILDILANPAQENAKALNNRDLCFERFNQEKISEKWRTLVARILDKC